ncbi:MAG: hypothetical protein RLZZ156_1734, partial [Deinococcota bacterium]
MYQTVAQKALFASGWQTLEK